MKIKKVVFFGSCWPTNIGNAFVNLGAIRALRAALGNDGHVWHMGGLSGYLFDTRRRPENNFPIARWADVDYAVMAGMTQCVDHFRAAEPMLRSFIRRGAKIVIAGGGAERYGDDETEAVRRYMTRLPIHCFISRDTFSFERFGDLAEHSYDGIDSAFFVSDGFDPLPLSLDEYIVLAFDGLSEAPVLNARPCETPDPDPSSRRIRDRGLASLRRLCTRIARPRANGRDVDFATAPIDADGRAVVRAHHSVTDLTESDFELPYTLISDLPSDYLSLYARAHTTYSDRVHACIATLAFGNRAQLFGRNVPRLRMFERVGAGEILQRPVRVEGEHLTKEKENQIRFLSEIL